MRRLLSRLRASARPKPDAGASAFTTPTTDLDFDGERLHVSKDFFARLVGFDPEADTATLSGIDAQQIVGMTLNVMRYGGGRGIEDIWRELANTLLNIGHANASIPWHMKSLHAKPSISAHQNALNALLLAPESTNRSLYEFAVTWAHLYEQTNRGSTPSLPPPITSQRPLRIGYVCAFFESSVMQHAMLPTLEALAERDVQIICYSDGSIPEACSTGPLEWRKTAELDDREMTALIERDALDVLVDLSGPVANHRFAVYAQKPASKLMSGPNYAATSGMSFFDFTISRKDLIKPEETQWYTEKVLYNDIFIGYSIPSADFLTYPNPGPPPVASARRITFGYFGSSHKINKKTVSIWCTILNKVHNSSIILKSGGFDQELTRKAVLRLFASEGISSDRVELRGISPFQCMLEEYADIDIALDAYPASGGSTMNHALCQGVPCLSLYGDRLLSRYGAVRLRCAGMNDWVGETVDELANIAAAKASDISTLITKRNQQREMLANSMLFNRGAFVDAFKSSVLRELSQPSNEAT